MGILRDESEKTKQEPFEKWIIAGQAVEIKPASPLKLLTNKGVSKFHRDKITTFTDRLTNLFWIVSLLIVAVTYSFTVGRSNASLASMKAGRGLSTPRMLKHFMGRVIDSQTEIGSIFFIQDPKDGLCLGRQQFRGCGFRTMWGTSYEDPGTVLGFPPDGPVDKGKTICLARTSCYESRWKPRRPGEAKRDKLELATGQTACEVQNSPCLSSSLFTESRFLCCRCMDTGLSDQRLEFAETRPQWTGLLLAQTCATVDVLLRGFRGR